MASSAPVCPVPKEQQPIHEYQALQESWFYRWALFERFKYVRPFLVLWGVGWIVSGPVADVSFPMAKEPLYFALSGAAGASVIPLLALFRLYLGWFYIRNRLTDESVVYEESGWYDGQIWQKTPEVLQRDRLIVTYQIQPLMHRLRSTFFAFLGSFAFGGIIWWLADVLRSPS